MLNLNIKNNKKNFSFGIGEDFVRNVLLNICEDSFISAIQMKQLWDEAKIELKGKEIAHSRQLLESEFERLHDRAKDFNLKFAHNNNKIFEESLNWLKQLRSGFAGFKKILYDFSPRGYREMQRKIIREKPDAAYLYSNICNPCYELNLFNLDSYPPSVKGLYNEIIKFLWLMWKASLFCAKIREEERECRKNKQYCVDSFLRLKQEVLDSLMFLRNACSWDAKYFEDLSNPTIESRLKCSSLQEWAPDAFHNHPLPEVYELITKEIFEESKGTDLTYSDRMIFGDDVNMARYAKNVINNTDNIIHPQYGGKCLPKHFVGACFEKFGLVGKVDKTKFVQYLNNIYSSNPEHRYNNIELKTFYTYQNKENDKQKVDEYKNTIESKFPYDEQNINVFSA